MRNFKSTIYRFLKKDEHQTGNFTFYLKTFWRLLKRSIIMIYHYLDVIKDCYLIWSIIEINGGYETLVRYEEFPTVIALCLIATVLFPLVLSSFHLAINCPGIIFGVMNEELGRWRWNSVFLATLTVLSSFLCPILLKNAYENVNQKITEESLYVKKKKKFDVIKYHFVTFMRIEFGT